MTDESDSRDVGYNQVGTIYGYQSHPQYGEWLIEGNDGPRPCRFENWIEEDLIGFAGGEFVKAYYENEGMNV